MPMTPQELRRHARYLYGGRWCVALANQAGRHEDDLFAMEAGTMPISQDVIDALTAAYRDRVDGLQTRLEMLEA